MKAQLAWGILLILIFSPAISQDLPPISAELVETLEGYEKQALSDAAASINRKRAQVVALLEQHLEQVTSSGGSVAQASLLQAKIKELQATAEVSLSNLPSSTEGLSREAAEIERLATTESLGVDRKEVKILASSGPNNPTSTGFRVSKGDVFAIYPNPDDQWGGGGTKTDVFCDYKGYPGKDSGWMRMEYKIGSGEAQIVHPVRWITADRDGFVQVYAQDQRPKGNPGFIRIVIVQP